MANLGHMVHYAPFGLLAPSPCPALRAGDTAGPQAALCHACRAFGLHRLGDLLPLQNDASTRPETASAAMVPRAGDLLV